MNKCPKCGYKFEKQYCQCRNLTIFDLVYNPMNNKDYCRKCEKEIDKIRVGIILTRPGI